MEVRNYTPEDYGAVSDLYKDSSTYGGQFDDARDTPERLQNLVKQKPDAILVAEDNEKILGTVTLFEDGRSAWLYRFSVANVDNSIDIARELFLKASEILKSMGHTQVLVYAPANNKFDERYMSLGFNKGDDYTAYWQNLS